MSSTSLKSSSGLFSTVFARWGKEKETFRELMVSIWEREKVSYSWSNSKMCTNFSQSLKSFELQSRSCEKLLMFMLTNPCKALKEGLIWLIWGINACFAFVDTLLPNTGPFFSFPISYAVPAGWKMIGKYATKA